MGQLLQLALDFDVLIADSFIVWTELSLIFVLTFVLILKQVVCGDCYTKHLI